MLVAFGMFVLAGMLELYLGYIPVRVLRQLAAIATALLLVFSSVALVLYQPSPLTIALAAANTYRLLNLARLLLSKMHEQHLRTVTRQTSAWLIVAQSAITGLWLIGLSPYTLLLIASLLYLTASVGILTYTYRSIHKTSVLPQPIPALPSRSFPSLTVAIPARNETDDLDACLISLLKSDYPKLEVLVLDDCSQNKRTPEIIRQFAHDGVRFLAGQVPPDNWLAKNFACQQLLQEANGEFVVFCGVDVRFSPTSLRALVATMQDRHKSMISVIPANLFPHQWPGTLSVLVQPLRYAWELALPRRLFNRPPVLSTCWVADRELLERAGGFAAVSRKVIPESYFARLATQTDGYSFLQATNAMNIISTKRLAEQVATALRTRYPQTHKRLELVAFFSVLELGGLAVPLTAIVLAVLGNIPIYFVYLSIATMCFFSAAFMLVVMLTYRRMVWWSLFLLVPAGFVDAFLLNYSMLQYEFFTVIWKDRNVCLPVMHMESGQAFEVQLATNGR